VAFLDGDDWWAREKLKRVVEALDADPAVGIVGHGIVMVERDGREQTETLGEGFRFQANTLEGARLLRVRAAHTQGQNSSGNCNGACAVSLLTHCVQPNRNNILGFLLLVDSRLLYDIANLPNPEPRQARSAPC
jgi:hypothetical protein